jgi:hypothetical protein
MLNFLVRQLRETEVVIGIRHINKAGHLVFGEMHFPKKLTLSNTAVSKA